MLVLSRVNVPTVAVPALFDMSPMANGLLVVSVNFATVTTSKFPEETLDGYARAIEVERSE